MSLSVEYTHAVHKLIRPLAFSVLILDNIFFYYRSIWLLSFSIDAYVHDLLVKKWTGIDGVWIPFTIKSGTASCTW
jgi:hypothetical protein